MKPEFRVLACFLALGLQAQAPLPFRGALGDARMAYAKGFMDLDARMAFCKVLFEQGRLRDAELLLSEAELTFPSERLLMDRFRRFFPAVDPSMDDQTSDAVLKDQIQAGVHVYAATMILAIRAYETPRPELAKQYLLQALELDPLPFEAVDLIRQMESKKKGSFGPDVLARCDAFQTGHPVNPKAWLRTASDNRNSDIPKLQDELAQALEKLPDNVVLISAQANLLEKATQSREAAENIFVRNPQDELLQSFRVSLEPELTKARANIQQLHLQAIRGNAPYAAVYSHAARYHLKLKDPRPEAVQAAYQAYFISPQEGNWDSKIKNVARDLDELNAQEQLENALKLGRALESLLADPNSRLRGLVLQRMHSAVWSLSWKPALLNALADDLDFIRGQSCDLLIKAPAGTVSDLEIETLLNEPDLLTRGMGGYLAVAAWGARGIQRIEPWLDSDVELQRFDAYSALLLHGGKDGQRVVESHIKKDPNERMKKGIQEVLQNIDALKKKHP